ncbi:serine/threonine-protein kinase SIK3 homolog [Leguminivora glycinivorella]|uniref:serine/threonine-protein kinase SIK3 homolog n=1 Tax=Leguminivora glycinivorella TaxID=1035111 RepID=UPI00200EE061|nr:serine/threonine-protein kinase SIK3 homolog [Leguminivora glycinivorella]
MKPTTRNKGQVYSVGNYLMTGKVLGKGHFARVEEATHRIIGKKVAIKIIDLTCIKEEYARRNLHREPRVMSKLRHPCIAALYETMMHGPRLYVVMEAAGGGDLCAHVLASRGPQRGLPEARAKALAAQLVSAVRHMHSQGVVHRDLKMENIMLDSTKQFIKIVDFGLSNVWSNGGALRTPCGSLEYAAPELFVDGRRYGPEVDLWSIGVIVYGMVTGGLPFTGADTGEGRSRPQLRAAIARGFARKQRVALACVSGDCKTFIQQLLEPNVATRMKIEEAARHRWIKRPGMRMRAHPLGSVEPKVNRELYKQISELCGQPIIDVVAQIKAEPFGAIAGIYNIKTHLQQLQSVPATDLLWTSTLHEPRPYSPPEYKNLFDQDRQEASCSQTPTPPPGALAKPNVIPKKPTPPREVIKAVNTIPKIVVSQAKEPPKKPELKPDLNQIRNQLNPLFTSMNRPVTGLYGVKKAIFRVYDNGDCGLDPRLPSINEHSNTDLNRDRQAKTSTVVRTQCKKISLENDRPLRLSSCPNKMDTKRLEFYRRAGDGLPSWRATGGLATPPARILLQNNATTIKRASLGNIVSPHSSSNSHCKSERAMPVGWYSQRANASKDTPHLQRFRRTAPMK